MAVILEGDCRVSEMREGDPLTNGTLRLWNRIGRASGAQAISLRVLEFGPGLSPAIRNDDCDQVLFVPRREGGLELELERGPGLERGHPGRLSERSKRNPNLSVATLFIDDNAYEIGPDTGIYLRPGDTFAVDNPGPAPVTFISAQCPDPNRPTQFGSQPSDSPRTIRKPPIVRLADRPAQSTADRWYRVLVNDEVGSTQVTQFVGSIPPGRAPAHFHNYEEVLVILRGEGRLWAGETNTPIAPGSCIYLPKGQVHCVENTGTGDLRLLGVFYPAGSPSVRYDV